MHTVADLLKKINMIHQIPEDSLILAIPLSRFSETEYPEVVTYLWLYNAKWIIPLDNKTAHMDIADLSRNEVHQFYQEILTRAKKIFVALKSQPTSKHTLPHWSMELVKHCKWLRPTQVTLYLQQFNLYKILFNNKRQNLLTYDTLGDLLQKIPIEIQDSFSPDIQEVMKFRIKDLGIITKEDLLKLTCYLTLFISRRAYITPLLVHYSYNDLKIKKAVQHVIEQHIELMQALLNHETKILDTNFDIFLTQKLSKKNINLDPEVLGLISFESCPFLKKIYASIWSKSGINTARLSYHSIGLAPHSNPFLYGLILYLIWNDQHIPINSHDLHLIVKIDPLINQMELGNNSFFQQDKIKNAKQNFEIYRSQIQNSLLRESINPRTFRTYYFAPLTNINAVIRFLSKYGCPTNFGDYPPDDILEIFLDTWNRNPNLMDDLVQTQYFVTFDQHSLSLQREKAQNTLVAITKEIKIIKLSNLTVSNQLKIQWLDLQHTIWSYFDTRLLELKLHLQVEQDEFSLAGTNRMHP